MSVLTIHRGHYRPCLQQPAHAHDELHLSLVLRGHVVEDIGGERHVGSSLSIVAKDPGVHHADAFGPEGATLIRLSFPGSLASLSGAGTPAPDWRWLHDAAAARPFLRIARRASALEERVCTDDDDLVDLLARVSPVTPSPRGRPPAWLAVIHARIVDEPSTASARLLAEQAGVHPVYLARAFRRWYGGSVRDLVRWSRVRDSAACLASTTASVSTIAQEMGFADEPHLCRTFRAEVGLTPSRFRGLARLA